MRGYYEIKLLKTIDKKTAREISSLMRQHVPNLPELPKEYFEKMVNDPRVKVFIALNKENQIIGITTMITYHKIDGVYKAYIEDVVVNEGDRRKGIGKALTNQVLQTAHAMKINTVHLTSHPIRIAANSLYKKMGFKIYGTNYYTYELSR